MDLWKSNNNEWIMNELIKKKKKNTHTLDSMLEDSMRVYLYSVVPTYKLYFEEGLYI